MRELTKIRIQWLLRRLRNTCYDSTVAWDEDTVDAFVEAFPEARKTLIYYMIGPNSSPMLNRTAKAAEQLGYIRAGHIGNQDARSYNQRTWCRTWTLTAEGKEAIK